MKLTTLLQSVFCAAILTTSVASFAQDVTAPTTPGNGAPTAPAKKGHKRFRRAFKFGVCVGEQLGKAGETLAKPVAGETPAQKQARKEANKALVKQAAQAGNCGKKKPQPTT